MAVGLNLILIVQLASAANELPQVCVCEKSAAFVPVIAIPAIVNVFVPTFVNVTALAALVVPTITEPKLKRLEKASPRFRFRSAAPAAGCLQHCP